MIKWKVFWVVMFSIVAVTNYHQFSSIKHRVFITSQFCRSEVWLGSHWDKSEVSADLCPLLGAVEKNLLLSSLRLLAEFSSLHCARGTKVPDSVLAVGWGSVSPSEDSPHSLAGGLLSLPANSLLPFKAICSQATDAWASLRVPFCLPQEKIPEIRVAELKGINSFQLLDTC